jgi:hypothetical protein
VNCERGELSGGLQVAIVERRTGVANCIQTERVIEFVAEPVPIRENLSACPKEVIERSLSLLQVRQPVLRKVTQRHIFGMAAVDCLGHVNEAYRAVCCQPQPHFQVACVRQLRPVSAHSLLEFGSDNGGGRGDNISSST